MPLTRFHTDAVVLLKELCTPHGFLASSIDADNYKRIWARDAMVCGLASIIEDDGVLLEGFKNSLLTLANHSHENGMIPSNVDPLSGDVSFGSLVGRIDANTWFVIGACLHFLHTNDRNTWDRLKPQVAQTLTYLKALEFNDRGWIYTPLSGNWADEYPVHGYTLYDNALYLWAQRLWAKCNQDIFDTEVELKTRLNFWPDLNTQEKMMYQNPSFKKAANTGCDHFAAFILPGKYDLRFDAAANGLAMLLWELNTDQKEGIDRTINRFSKEIGKSLVPAFWPIIDKQSEDWFLLEGNYSFDFKNTPGAFHNGGIWPVWMGLFCMGLAKQGMQDKVHEIAAAFSDTVRDSNDWQFQEFFHATQLQFQGKSQMGYSASGIVFLNAALHNKTIAQLLHI